MAHHPVQRVASCCYRWSAAELKGVDGPSTAKEGGRWAIDRLLGGRPAVAGLPRHGMARQGVARPRGAGQRVGGHGAGSKYGSVTPSVTSRKTTRTGIPARTSSGGQPVMPVISHGPSASSTSAIAYGILSANAKCVGWRTTV